jgi:hypothetical protein
MSNPLAIQAVTNTLRELLSYDDAIEAVSVRPPDRLLNNDASGRLNLYLYRVAPNTAWQNCSLPDRSRGSESAFPPLALDLFYLLTAYGDESERSREHELLGRAMHILHNNASLSPAFVRRATQGLSGGEYISDLHEQIERIRITHDPLSVDDLSKLWNTFQTQYRISTAYRVSVVLIDSAKRTGSALPVLRRGEEDRGVRVFASLEPRLDEITYHHATVEGRNQYGASIKSRITLSGNNFPAFGLKVIVRDPRLSSNSDLNADIVATIDANPSEKPNQVDFALAPDIATWQSGVYWVQVAFDRDDVTRKSNTFPIAIVPEIRKRIDGRPIVNVFREDNKNKLQVEIINGIATNRSAYLVLNGKGGMFQLPRDRRSKEDSDEAPVFHLKNIPVGQYRLRVRVDGVDSLMTIVRNTDSPYPEFDSNMVVTV